MFGLRESFDGKRYGWHEDASKDGDIPVHLKTQGLVDAIHVTVRNFDIRKAQKIIDAFVENGEIVR